MSVPRVAFAVVGLHHAYAFFDQAHRHEAAQGRAARPIKVQDRFTLFADVEYIWSFRLHTERGLHRFDGGLELRVFVVQT